ncbi:MAG: hypothetical protein U0Q18_25380 [Bryobacteraceae bacterium]
MDKSKLLLLGIGALLLWEWYKGQSAAAAPAGGTLSTAATGTGTSTGTGTGTAAAPTYNDAYYQSLAAKMQAAAGANVKSLRPVEWAYYYSQITGRTPAPSAQQLGLDANQQYTVLWYLQAYKQAGLGGLGVMAYGPADFLARQMANQARGPVDLRPVRYLEGVDGLQKEYWDGRALRQMTPRWVN